MAAEITGITDSNRADIESRLDRIEAHLDYLVATWKEHAPLLATFKTHGLLGARRAMRNAGPGPLAQALGKHGSLDNIPERDHG